MIKGTIDNPICRLKQEHLMGARDATVYYIEVDYRLDLPWAFQYTKTCNVNLVKVQKQHRGGWEIDGEKRKAH